MTAFPKADVQNVRIGIEPNGRLWPKADIETESKWVFLNGCFGGKKRTFSVSIGVDLVSFQLVGVSSDRTKKKERLQGRGSLRHRDGTHTTAMGESQCWLAQGCGTLCL